MARTRQTARRPAAGSVTAAATSAASSNSAAPFDETVVGSAPDVFGPSHALFQLVSAASALPDVLTRLIVQYASPLYPRQSHYAGNVVTRAQSRIKYTATEPASAASSSAPSTPAASSAAGSSHGGFSLSSQSWSVSGWMKRAVASEPQFLLSVFPPSPRTPINSHLHIGYTCHPHGSPTNCFTVGFYANDLDVAAPLVDVAAHRQWEHFCVTLQYPRPDHCGPFQPPATAHTHAAYKDATAPNLARRSLYRNGRLIAADDCQPPAIADCHTVLVGQYDYCTFRAFEGGLCDLRMYSRALAGGEVAALYGGQCDAGQGGTEGLEVWWKMDGSAGAFDERVVRDFSGHERHAVVEGAPLQLSMTGGCDAQRDSFDNTKGATKRVRT